MTAKELKEVLSELPDDFPVYVIFNGTIDRDPSFNVEESEIYIEGVDESNSQ